MSDLSAFIVAGSGEAAAFERDLFDPRIRASIRYADQAAWITATAVTKTLAAAGDGWSELRHQIGMIVLGNQGPGATMAGMQEEGTKGFSSPLHYAASGPWTLVGVSCIAFGFRGPTLSLTMDPQDGLPTALTLCQAWLARKAARLMVVAACRTDAAGATLARALLLAPPGVLTTGKQLTAPELAWLTAEVLNSGASA
jgi:hypothetical protein